VGRHLLTGSPWQLPSCISVHNEDRRILPGPMARLRILSINDIYTLDHLPRLANLLRAQVLPAPDVTISIVAGDFVGPSLLSSLDAGRGMVDCLNALGIAYAILGNHEDDIPTVELHARIAEFRGRWLSTNVDFDAAMPRDAIVAVGERSVGLVAVVDDDRAMYRDAPFGGAPMRLAHADALAAAADLRARGCATVVAITHQDIARDRELARTHAFPLVVGGHEHVAFLEQVEGTWVVKAGADGVAAIVSDLVWSATGELAVTASRVTCDAYPEDAEVRALVDRHMAKVRELADATLVRVAPGELLSSAGTRVRQTTMGALLCTRVRDAMRAELAVLNGGGIRANRDYPERFTYGDLEAEVPFDNELVVVAMPGRTIKAAIAASRAHAPRESGGFLQADFDPAALDDAHTYRLALVRNLFAGMDHNEPLIRFAADHPDAIPPAGTGRDIKHLLAEAFAIELWKKLGGFDQIDLDHDGNIDEAEVMAALARISGEAPSHVVAHLVMHALDKDGDARVTRAELP
jgi:2',3'-cyclic-nucleotide 2'-phosphodiesterase (5'-nucleotidase family)